MLRKSSQAFPQSSWDKSSFWNGQDIVSTNTGSNLSLPPKKKILSQKCLLAQNWGDGGGVNYFSLEQIAEKISEPSPVSVLPFHLLQALEAWLILNWF